MSLPALQGYFLYTNSCLLLHAFFYSWLSPDCATRIVKVQSPLLSPLVTPLSSVSTVTFLFHQEAQHWRDIRVCASGLLLIISLYTEVIKMSCFYQNNYNYIQSLVGGSTASFQNVMLIKYASYRGLCPIYYLHNVLERVKLKGLHTKLCSETVKQNCGPLFKKMNVIMHLLPTTGLWPFVRSAER